MVHRGILSHKLRKFFRKVNLASNASGAPNCPFHKSGKQGIWRTICEKSSVTLRLFWLVEVKPGMLISKAQAEEYLKADLIAFERYLNGLGLALNQNQFDALVSFIYNVGTGNFSNSTLLRKVRANPQENSIMDEFLRWVYSKGRVLPGLQRRRLAEMKLYFSND